MISTSADSLTSMESPGVSSTIRPLSRLATSTLINLLTDLSTKTNNQTYFTTSTSKGSDTGKGLLIGGIVGGVVCLVLAVIIIYCCWRHMCKRDSVTPENIGRKGPQRPVSNDEEAIKGPDMPVEGALSRDGTTVSTGKVLLGMPEVIPSFPPKQTSISTQANSSKMNGGITDSNIGNRLPALSPHDVLDMDKTKKKKKKKKKKKNKCCTKHKEGR
ncbi:uncharacterized protein LOC117328475 [Pecten maximus]|uniref:uncharacterized protein LOC117328475 n=1 Tax=Pecten maximus TaxID=6579 RepID=UPI0014583DD1|nr:uncharacterized protein LOC117328475 [Pecten maximus]